MEKFAAGLEVRMAVVQLKPGESTEEAWKRHLAANPGDALAMLKVFTPASASTNCNG